MFFIDRELCLAHGRLVEGAKLEYRGHPLRSDPLLASWAEAVFVALCHKTNWDRLHDHVMKVASSSPERLNPNRLSCIGEEDALNLIGPGLENFSGFDERIRILRSLGSRGAVDFLQRMESHIADRAVVPLAGTGGLYEALDCIAAFSEDPLRKKARVYVHQLLSFRLIDIKDPESVAPAVDHHLIRLYLRTGRLVLEGESAGARNLTALRSFVEKAMVHSASGAGLRVDELDHIEWQIARSYCVREEARCQRDPLPEKPVDSTVADLAKMTGGCPLQPRCMGAQSMDFRSMTEPDSEHSYY